MDTKRLKQLRQSANLTQGELATKLGFSQQRYNTYETGKREPDSEALLGIAVFFDVSVDYLLGREVDDKEDTKKDPVAEAAESLQRFVENKLGREPNQEELETIEAAANGLIERLKKQGK
ncbi:MAG: helix-turn-helix domain-containing protein [Oscillospiraceae bacterium]